MPRESGLPQTTVRVRLQVIERCYGRDNLDNAGDDLVHCLAIVRGAHHARRDTGTKLAELGFSEARLRQLIEADGALLCDLLPTLARRLAAAGVTLDWRPLAEMALALDDESGQARAQRARLQIVQGFLRASAAKAGV